MPRHSACFLASVLLVVGLAGCDSHVDKGVTASSRPTTSSSGPTTTTSAPPIEGGGQVLPRSGGCADAFFWAANTEGTLAVTVNVDARQRSGAAPTVIDFTLPDPKVEIEIQRGRGLVQPFCNDLISQEWHVDSRDHGVEGKGRITLNARRQPSRCGSSHGRLQLDGLVAGDGTRFATIDVPTANIGCYAG
jgi:hypothetical protein